MKPLAWSRGLEVHHAACRKRYIAVGTNLGETVRKIGPKMKRLSQNTGMSNQVQIQGRMQTLKGVWSRNEGQGQGLGEQSGDVKYFICRNIDSEDVEYFRGRLFKGNQYQGFKAEVRTDCSPYRSQAKKHEVSEGTHPRNQWPENKTKQTRNTGTRAAWGEQIWMEH